MNLSADRQGRIDNVHSRDAFYRNIWDGIPYFSNRSNRKGIYSTIIREICGITFLNSLPQFFYRV